jgi:hypothetical protein
VCNLIAAKMAKNSNTKNTPTKSLQNRMVNGAYPPQKFCPPSLKTMGGKILKRLKVKGLIRGKKNQGGKGIKGTKGENPKGSAKKVNRKTIRR